MRWKVGIIAILVFLMSSLVVNATDYTSEANSDSKKVKYSFTATLTRTGEKTATLSWKIKPTWVSGGEGHNSPTKITATVTYGKKKKTVTIKKAGNNSLSTKTGSFDITVTPTQTTESISLSASGSGSYTTTRTETYTYYTTETVYYRALSVYHSSSGEYQISDLTEISASQASNYTTTYKTNGYMLITSTKSVKHTGTKTVTDTHKTDSGTLKKKTLDVSGMEKWYYISYDGVGGTPVPATHGFIGGKTTTISTTTPKYWCADVRKYGYSFTGWSTTKYAINTGTVNYTGGQSYSTKADLKLYAVYKANKIGRIVFHANGGDQNTCPAPIDKYYNVNAHIPDTIPSYPDIENKGQRMIFVCWNTKADGTGDIYGPGSAFTANFNRHEAVPQDNINLYAIWYRGEDGENEQASNTSKPGIRYIDKDSVNTLNKDSKWRSGVRQQQLEDSLNKEGSGEADSVYDYRGNKTN